MLLAATSRLRGLRRAAAAKAGDRAARGLRRRPREQRAPHGPLRDVGGRSGRRAARARVAALRVEGAGDLRRSHVAHRRRQDAAEGRPRARDRRALRPPRSARALAPAQGRHDRRGVARRRRARSARRGPARGRPGHAAPRRRGPGRARLQPRARRGARDALPRARRQRRLRARLRGDAGLRVGRDRVHARGARGSTASTWPSSA